MRFFLSYPQIQVKFVVVNLKVVLFIILLNRKILKFNKLLFLIHHRVKIKRNIFLL